MSVPGRGGLNPRPVNAPQGVAPAPGVQPGQSVAVVTANKVIVFGPSDGIFVYNGPIAKGNLVAVIAPPGGGTDPVGDVFNDVLEIGAWSPAGTVTSHLSVTATGVLSLSNVNPAVTLFLEADKELAAIYNNAGRAAGNLVAAIAGMASDDGVTNTFAAGFTGRATAFQPNVSPQAPETWHNMVLAAGFAAGGSTPRYRLMPDNTVMLAGAVNLTANEAAGTAFWAAPAGYPATVSSFYTTFNTLSGFALGNASVKIEAGGAARINVAGSTGNSFNLDEIRYPLD